MKTDFDVVVAGGGPAGFAAAITLAAQGMRTCVVERRALPASKACGEGILPTGASYLQALDILKHIPEEKYSPITGVTYLSLQSRRAQGVFRHGSGLGINRLHLSQGLLRRARELSCLRVVEGQDVKPVSRYPGFVLTQVGSRLVSARLLIAADGGRSPIRQWAGLDGERAQLQRWGIRQHFACQPWSSSVEVYWGEGVEAYVTPTGPREVNVAFLWDRELFSHLPGGAQLFPYFLKRFPDLAQRLADAEPVDPARSIGPMQSSASRTTADGLILIGDAAGYYDAITGEGISLALGAAVSLTTTVIPGLRQAIADDTLVKQDTLQGYARYQRMQTAGNRLTTWLALTLRRSSSWTEVTVSMFDHAPRIFETLLAVNMGLSPFRWRSGHESIQFSRSR